MHQQTVFRDTRCERVRSDTHAHPRMDMHEPTAEAKGEVSGIIAVGGQHPILQVAFRDELLRLGIYGRIVEDGPMRYLVILFRVGRGLRLCTHHMLTKIVEFAGMKYPSYSPSEVHERGTPRGPTVFHRRISPQLNVGSGRSFR